MKRATRPTRRLTSRYLVAVLLLVGMGLVLLATMPSRPVVGAAALPPSLKSVIVPEPPNLAQYVQDRQAAIKLGKALFWDMQVGSDGVQACASCHFQAGTDNRSRNQTNPGGDNTFQIGGGPNYQFQGSDFPFHQRQSPLDQQESPVLRTSDDVAGSPGVRFTQFGSLTGSAVDAGVPLPDPVFNVGGTNVRRVTGRNAPTVINAVFNYANFWDGRANNIFNGVNPFGASDQQSKIFVNTTQGLEGQFARIRNASLASQAVGPPLNDVEMSWAGRTFPQLGRKMLGLKPLAGQQVHPTDSVLALLSESPAPGLRTTYDAMIRAAFRPEYWDNTTQILTFQGNVGTILPHPGRPLQADEFTQMEANFSLFFGLAIQLYEATLVSDDSPFDRLQEGRKKFSDQEWLGLGIFFDEGGCAECHVGSEFTDATVSVAAFQDNTLNDLMEMMPMGDLEYAVYDVGYYNAGVRPTADDLGRGGLDPFGRPLSFARLADLKAQGLLPPAIADYTPDLSVVNFPPTGTFTVPLGFRKAVDGSFKVPTLRNVELTGPYFHNGSAATLAQVVEFYTRGGNFPQANRPDLDAAIVELIPLQGLPQRREALIAFLLTLTDDRVREESAPFDHPQLLIPIGSPDAQPGQDLWQELPAIGQGGRVLQALAPLKPFMDTNPFGFTPTPTPPPPPPPPPTNTPTPVPTATVTPTPTPTPTRPAAWDAYEPDSSLAQARTIASDGVAQQRTLHAADDEDWVSFAAGTGIPYRISTTDLAPGVDTVVSIHASKGAVLALNDDHEGRASLVVWTAPAAGTYFVKVKSYSVGSSYGATATYSLRVAGEIPFMLAPTPTPVPGQSAPPLVADVNPTLPSYLVTSNGGVAIGIPAGALGVTETVTMSYAPERLPSPMRSGEMKGLLAFSLRALTAGGQQITQLGGPISVTIRYNDADVAGLNENTLAVYYKNSQGEYAEVLSVERYPQQNVIVATLNHLSYFVLEAKPLHTVYLPTVGR